MTMQMLYIHWKAVRLGLLPFVLAAFGLPLLVARAMASRALAFPTDSTASALSGLMVWIGYFPVLAAVIGCLLALSAWNWDHKGNHVYALSLPISRNRYAVLKFSAGAVLALVPVAALLTGSIVAMFSVDLPVGLHAYPVQLAGRFLISILIVYAVVFALASGTIRTTVIVLSVLIAVPVVLSLGQLRPIFGDVSPEYWITQALLYGPFRVLFGSWMLFDV